MVRGRWRCQTGVQYDKTNNLLNTTNSEELYAIYRRCYGRGDNGDVRASGKYAVPRNAHICSEYFSAVKGGGSSGPND